MAYLQVMVAMAVVVTVDPQMMMTTRIGMMMKRTLIEAVEQSQIELLTQKTGRTLTTVMTMLNRIGESIVERLIAVEEIRMTMMMVEMAEIRARVQIELTELHVVVVADIVHTDTNHTVLIQTGEMRNT